MCFTDIEGKIVNPWDYKQLEEIKKKKALLEIHILCYNNTGRDKNLEEK